MFYINYLHTIKNREEGIGLGAGLREEEVL